MVTIKPYNESWHLTETAYDVPFTVLIPADLETGNPDIAHGWLVAPVSLTENVFILSTRTYRQPYSPGTFPRTY